MLSLRGTPDTQGVMGDVLTADYIGILYFVCEFVLYLCLLLSTGTLKKICVLPVMAVL